MKAQIAEINDIPAALPISEVEDEREKLIEQAAEIEIETDENEFPESEDDEEFDETGELAKPSKKKLFLAFVCFVFGFVLLVGLISWFFGIGVFAKAKTQAVDRTAKNSSSATSDTPVTEEEKLKMALNLIAEKNPNGQADLSNTDSGENIAGDPNFNSSVDIPSTKAADLTEPVIVPDSVIEPNRNAVNSPTVSPKNEVGRTQNYSGSNESQPFSSGNQTNSASTESNRIGEIAPLGRSLFFGIERKGNTSANLPSQLNNQTVIRTDVTDSSNNTVKIPFGTLLPIRFLGAVFTLRSSGGLVRMELTRSVSGKNYSYPAGTVLVVTLRGSEYKRAFVSVVGLIDSKTGGLVKFEGEVMGGDGASGVVGRRRQIKSAWSRVFSGMRDAGAIALGAIGNRRSGGGTVIISDSTSKASGVLTEELSGIVGDKKKSGEFIEVTAGTTGFVLVTDLPDEISNIENLNKNTESATGLGERELADLFSEGSPEKIRAALPRMTSAFRELAAKVLATMEGGK
ncbi:hypothetical protein BH20ACI1_BH20ACI1_26560 [soil metagenome]